MPPIIIKSKQTYGLTETPAEPTRPSISLIKYPHQGTSWHILTICPHHQHVHNNPTALRILQPRTPQRGGAIRLPGGRRPRTYD